jgi:acyl-CoA synthetase (AMP-forming)/AMP-acid ligase II
MRAQGESLVTLKDLVDRNARLHGEDLFLVFGERRQTFREFADRARRLASALHLGGLRKQDRVAILAMNCPEYLELYGVGEVAPFIVAPVNFRLAAPEILYVVRDAAPVVLFFEKQYEATIEALRDQFTSVRRYVCIGGAAPAWAESYETVVAQGTTDGPGLEVLPGDIHAIMYTSGTTGRPKGAMLTHGGYLALIADWARELDADTGDKILLSMPFFHVGARSQGGALTYAGGTLVILRSFDARTVVSTIPAERITQIHLAPTLVQQVLDHPGQEKFDFSSLKTLNYAAAPMPVTVLKRALQRFGRIMINGFGQTEGAGTVLKKHYHRPDGDERDLRRLASIGQPTTATSMAILDENDLEAPAGTIGEICFQSATVMAGYWNNSVATIETLRNGWLHTGDVGYADEDGFVYLVDRKKDMIVSGGENVYSREVEEALMGHDAVADAAVIGVPDVRWGEAVLGVIVTRDGASVTPEELIKHCRGLIAGYKCPKRIEYVAQLPRLPSGKISKLALREQFAMPTAAQ